MPANSIQADLYVSFYFEILMGQKSKYHDNSLVIKPTCAHAYQEHLKQPNILSVPQKPPVPLQEPSYCAVFIPRSSSDTYRAKGWWVCTGNGHHTQILHCIYRTLNPQGCATWQCEQMLLPNTRGSLCSLQKLCKNPTTLKFSDENVHLKTVSDRAAAFLTLHTVLKQCRIFFPCFCTLAVAGENVEEVKNFVFVHHCHFSRAFRTEHGVIHLLLCLIRLFRGSFFAVLHFLSSVLYLLSVFQNFLFVNSAVHHKHRSVLCFVRFVPKENGREKMQVIN